MNRKTDKNNKNLISEKSFNGNDSGKTGDVIRPRAFFLGLVLAVAICAISPFNNAYRQATPLGGGHFP